MTRTSEEPTTYYMILTAGGSQFHSHIQHSLLKHPSARSLFAQTSTCLDDAVRVPIWHARDARAGRTKCSPSRQWTVSEAVCVASELFKQERTTS